MLHYMLVTTLTTGRGGAAAAAHHLVEGQRAAQGERHQQGGWIGGEQISCAEQVVLTEPRINDFVLIRRLLFIHRSSFQDVLLNHLKIIYEICDVQAYSLSSTYFEAQIV